MKFCESCIEIYHDGNAIQDEVCPKIDCFGKIHTADEMIAPAVRWLFSKGYEVEDSCSGHAHDPNTLMWILFRKGISVDTYPQEMDVMLDEDGRLIMKKPFFYECIIERQRHIFKAVYELTQWVESLEPF